MFGKYFLLSFLFVPFSLLFSQLKQQFSVNDNHLIGEMVLHFSVNSGSCLIQKQENKTNKLLLVYGNDDYNDYHTYTKEIHDQICNVNLNLKNQKEIGLGNSISYRMFGNSNEKNESEWKIFLSENKPYTLNLKYNIGVADIDLSDLMIKNIKINTGSADVGVKTDTYNEVEMDTFNIQVDMGTVNVHNVNKIRVQNVIADIGLGNLLLDFSDTCVSTTQIKGSVGAGNLFIMLPKDETPIIIKIKDSWLCKVNMNDSFIELEKNTFINRHYSDDADNFLSFDLDVSMGKIVFK